MVYVSWQDLLDGGYVSGRRIEIDGTQYTCRLLDGGEDFAVSDDGHGGAADPTNEWDQLVCNEAGVEGLPIPTNADVARSIDDVVREDRHNLLLGILSTWMSFSQKWVLLSTNLATAFRSQSPNFLSYLHLATSCCLALTFFYQL